MWANVSMTSNFSNSCLTPVVVKVSASAFRTVMYGWIMVVGENSESAVVMDADPTFNGVKANPMAIQPVMWVHSGTLNSIASFC